MRRLGALGVGLVLAGVATIATGGASAAGAKAPAGAGEDQRDGRVGSPDDDTSIIGRAGCGTSATASAAGSSWSLVARAVATPSAPRSAPRSASAARTRTASPTTARAPSTSSTSTASTSSTTRARR